MIETKDLIIWQFPKAVHTLEFKCSACGKYSRNLLLHQVAMALTQIGAPYKVVFRPSMDTINSKPVDIDANYIEWFQGELEENDQLVAILDRETK